jgi:hypothetical protein
VVINSISQTSSGVFIIATNPGPIIASFSPTKGVDGVTVIIDGFNFDPVDANNTVTFSGGVKGKIIAATMRKIQTEVPVGAVTGPITVTTLDGTDLSANDFEIVTDPTVVSFFPDAGLPGASVTIEGYNFDPAPANNLVFFGATSSGVAVATDRQLITAAPLTLTPGFHTVSVRVNGFTTIASQQFNTLIMGSDEADGMKIEKVYHNAEGVHIELSDERERSALRVEVYGLDGKLIGGSDLQGEGEHLLHLNLSNGAYVLFISEQGVNVLGKKFFVE